MIHPSMIWLVEGPAHFYCWVEEVKKIPISKPKTFNPNDIYPDYFDAMTGKKLTGWQVHNRYRKRQFFTLGFDGAYLAPGEKRVYKVTRYPFGKKDFFN